MLCWTSSKMEDLCDSATASQLSQCILLTVFRPKFSVLNVRVMVGAFNQALKGAYSLIVKLRLKLYWTYSRTWTRDGSGAVPRPRHCEVSAQFAASGADMPRHQPSAHQPSPLFVFVPLFAGDISSLLATHCITLAALATPVYTINTMFPC